MLYTQVFFFNLYSCGSGCTTEWLDSRVETIFPNIRSLNNLQDETIIHSLMNALSDVMCSGILEINTPKASHEFLDE